MTYDSWKTSDDWRSMLGMLKCIDRSRKLRLWCVAWSRAILNAEKSHLEILQRWFSADFLAGCHRELNAAERFADNLIDRQGLQGERHPSGGPHNVFHLASGIGRSRVEVITRGLSAFIQEFSLPEQRQLANLIRDIFGNPFHPIVFDPQCRTDTALSLARGMYESRDFSGMPILADALQDAGCDNADILTHCRDETLTHVRGCWVVDLVLGKE
jgi:hypothetical protein